MVDTVCVGGGAIHCIMCVAGKQQRTVYIKYNIVSYAWYWRRFHFQSVYLFEWFKMTKNWPIKTKQSRLFCEFTSI